MPKAPNSMKKAKRKLLIIIIVAAAVVAGVFVFKRYHNYGTGPATGTTSGSAYQSQTYTKLVKEYAGRRIQLDTNCQASPSYITYKNGTKIMVDSRSPESRNVTIGGVHYSFGPYAYRIITLFTKNPPATVSINCGKAVNVGTILIQK